MTNTIKNFPEDRIKRKKKNKVYWWSLSTELKSISAAIFFSSENCILKLYVLIHLQKKSKIRFSYLWEKYTDEQKKQNYMIVIFFD